MITSLQQWKISNRETLRRRGFHHKESERRQACLVPCALNGKAAWCYLCLRAVGQNLIGNFGEVWCLATSQSSLWGFDQQPSGINNIMLLAHKTHNAIGILNGDENRDHGKKCLLLFFNVSRINRQSPYLWATLTDGGAPSFFPRCLASPTLPSRQQLQLSTSLSVEMLPGPPLAILCLAIPYKIVLNFTWEEQRR